jgi:hypothetical protein
LYTGLAVLHDLVYSCACTTNNSTDHLVWHPDDCIGSVATTTAAATAAAAAAVTAPTAVPTRSTIPTAKPAHSFHSFARIFIAVICRHIFVHATICSWRRRAGHPVDIQFQTSDINLQRYTNEFLHVLILE